MKANHVKLARFLAMLHERNSQSMDVEQQLYIYTRTNYNVVHVEGSENKLIDTDRQSKMVRILESDGQTQRVCPRIVLCLRPRRSFTSLLSPGAGTNRWVHQKSGLHFWRSQTSSSQSWIACACNVSGGRRLFQWPFRPRCRRHRSRTADSFGTVYV